MKWLYLTMLTLVGDASAYTLDDLKMMSAHDYSSLRWDTTLDNGPMRAIINSVQLVGRMTYEPVECSQPSEPGKSGPYACTVLITSQQITVGWQRFDGNLKTLCIPESSSETIESVFAESLNLLVGQTMRKTTSGQTGHQERGHIAISICHRKGSMSIKYSGNMPPAPVQCSIKGPSELRIEPGKGREAGLQISCSGSQPTTVNLGTIGPTAIESTPGLHIWTKMPARIEVGGGATVPSGITVGATVNGTVKPGDYQATFVYRIDYQ